MTIGSAVLRTREDWWWCCADRLTFEVDGAPPARSHHKRQCVQTVGETKSGQAEEGDQLWAPAWAPFRHRMFAAMSAAAFISNVGSWMQTVGAQWLMLTLTGSATYVALVQSAASVPIFLFAVLAGTIGDLVDRRQFGDRCTDVHVRVSFRLRPTARCL